MLSWRERGLEIEYNYNTGVRIINSGQFGVSEQEYD